MAGAFLYLCETRSMPLNFVAIDFETANGSPASPCAVGLIRVVDGKSSIRSAR